MKLRGTSEKMKKITYLLFIGLTFTLLGCGTAVATKEQSKQASSTGRAPFSTMNLPDMSMDEFVQIKNGMTYEQVTALVGSLGSLVAETGNPGNQLYTLTYQFRGQGNMWSDANAQLVFQDGKLISKAQKGIFQSEYERIGKLE